MFQKETWFFSRLFTFVFFVVLHATLTAGILFLQVYSIFSTKWLISIIISHSHFDSAFGFKMTGLSIFSQTNRILINRLSILSN